MIPSKLAVAALALLAGPSGIVAVHGAKLKTNLRSPSAAAGRTTEPDSSAAAAAPPSHALPMEVDVISVGSATRPAYLAAQAATWANPAAVSAVRNFWGFAEDDDGICSVRDSAQPPVASCAARPDLGFHDAAIESYVRANYGSSEGSNRSSDRGWTCAQRRLPIALGTLQSKYQDGDFPDLLAIVDDDTYLDVELVRRYMGTFERGDVAGPPLARAACVFDANEVGSPFLFAYGGFGTFLDGSAVRALARPIVCEDAAIAVSDMSCASLAADRIGESRAFAEGMSALQLFAAYASLDGYCMHSDWLVGYMIEHYLHADVEDGAGEEVQLAGMKTYPSCGNVTAAGRPRPCLDGMASCHRQTPEGMESMALASYVREEGKGFNAVPHLRETAASRVDEMIEAKKEEAAKRQKDGSLLPNILLIGAQKAASTSVAEWMYDNGVCRPENFDDKSAPGYHRYFKEVHFFDEVERYEQGLEFYSRRFQHCVADGEGDNIMDATPETLTRAKRVHELYVNAGEDAVSALKMIVILREPVSRELSLYNHKRVEYLQTKRTDMWYSDVASTSGRGVMTFDEYTKDVLTPWLIDPDWKNTGMYADHLREWVELFGREKLLVLSYDEVKTNPDKAQWRIQQFLDARFPKGELPRANVLDHKDKATEVPKGASAVLEPLFREKNQELYRFLDAHPGSWMEAYPFPRFDETSKTNKFAYATVLGYNPDQSQQLVYLEAALVWIHSLRRTGSEADIVVLMNYNDAETEETLKTAGVIVKHIEGIERKQDHEHFEPFFADIAFAKLHAFELIDYDRVQLMDVDVAIEHGKNLDVLFAHAPDAKLVSEGLGADSPLRAGWLVLKPSESDFAALKSLAENGKFDEKLGWDLLDLPEDYPGWTLREDASNKWGFYGSQLEQGLLYHYFYALPKSKDPSSDASILLTLLDDEELNSHGLVHFYGDRKPWGTVNKDSHPDFVLSAQAQWRQTHRMLKFTPPAALFKSPLTPVGKLRYLEERALYGDYASSNVVRVPGGFSVSTDVCNLNGDALSDFITGSEETIEQIVSDPNAQAVITQVCGNSANARRRLQTGSSQNWDVLYEVIVSLACGTVDCTDTGDISSINDIVDAISDAVQDSISSGSFEAALTSNQNIIDALGSDVVNCLAVWGTALSSQATLSSSGSSGISLVSGLAAVNATSGRFYPDWEGVSGSCLDDGEEPLYMKLNPDTWMYDTLEDCCQRYYPFSQASCLGSQGTGLWYVSYVEEKCVTDCEKGTGGASLCGGVTSTSSSELYSDPRACCEQKLGWVFVEVCVNDSLLNHCYGGTKKWYRGDTDELCVQDCDPVDGDTCGGIVDETWVRLHDSVEECCSAEQGWIEEDLCAARSTGTIIEKFWADQGNSKCVKDSETPSKDLSVALFDTAEECCTEKISWKTLPECVSDATGIPVPVVPGSEKWFVSWTKQQCAKLCEGPAPCGGLDPQGVGINDYYDDLSSCCSRLTWVERSECELA